MFQDKGSLQTSIFVGCPCNLSENAVARFAQTEQKYVLLWLVCKCTPHTQNKQKKKTKEKSGTTYSKYFSKCESSPLIPFSSYNSCWVLPPKNQRHFCYYRDTF